MSKKILVIDDDPPILKGIEMVLKNAGYETKASLKGEEAIPLAESFKPDLILLDIMLGILDGRKVAQELKSGSATKHIPIITISADRSLGKDTAKYGIDTFISKPFSSALLIKTIDRYCK